MNQLHLPSPPLLFTVACALVFMSAACGGDNGDGQGPSPSVDAGSETPDAGATATYAIGTLVFGPESSNAYLQLVGELGTDGEMISIEHAREFPGQSDLASFQGSVLVASGDEPSITKYEVGADLALVEGGEVSFASYGLASAAFWNNQFVADDKAYMVNGSSELIVWNPETMEIEATIELPEPAARAGLNLVPGLADRSSIVHDGKFYLPMYWTDDSYAQRSDDSLVVVVDVATDSVEASIPADCPGLDHVTIDEEGTLYFSNWTGGVGTYYVLETAQNCIAVLDTTDDDDEVTTTTFASFTGGHEGAAYTYAGDGRFVVSVFDEVRADAANADDPFAVVGENNWKLWMYEPASGDAAPIDAVDWNSGAITHTWLDNTLYSMVPGEGYASTVVYSHGSSGSAAPAFSITGWSFRLFRVR